MDYFSELLDSYDKLKKRTFKLRYISEEEGKKSEAEAKEKRQAAVKAVANDVKGAFVAAMGGEPQIGVGNAQNLNFENAGEDLQGFADESGNPQVKVSGSNIGEKLYTKALWDNAWSGNWEHSGSTMMKLCSAWLADAEDGGSDAAAGDAAEAQRLAAEKAAMEEAARLAQLRKIGGFFEQEDIENPTAVQAMEASKRMVDNFCLANKSVETLGRFCKRSWSYFAAGENDMGLEYKLATATTVRVIDEDGTTEEGGRANTALVAEAAISAAFLTSFLNSSSEFKCGLIKERIGMFQGGKLVLYGSDKTEGIVVGKPNALHKLALKKIKASKEDGGCGVSQADLSQLSPEVENEQEAMNAIKGTFYEAIMAFSARLLIAQGNKKKMGEARDLLLATVKKNKRILKKIIESVDRNAGESLELAHELSVQRTILESMSDPGSFFEGVMREIDSVQPFMEFMSPPQGVGFGVIEGGKVSKTGQRADLVFTYTDPKVAKAKAEAIGSSVSMKQPDGTYHVPIGLKRLAKLKATKFGEINNQTRMTDLLTGDLVVDDNIEPGFAASMQTRQYGGPSTEREERQQEYARDLEASLAESTSQLLEDKTYIDGEGKIKSQTPEGVLNQLADNVVSMLSFEDQTYSIISRAFFTITEEGDNLLKNFQGNGKNAVANREEAREKVARCARYSLLKKDSEGVPRSEDDTPEEIEQRQMAAKDYMIKSALICGSNTKNLSQVIVTDSGEMLDIKHNELFDKICEAQNDPDSDQPTFKFSGGGSTVTMCVDGLCLSVGQTGTPGPDDTRETRTTATVSKNTLENPLIQGNLSQAVKPQNNSSFEEYIKGHIQLLETFLS